MAVYHPEIVTCHCGHRFPANLSRSVNAGRSPAVREAILRGKFHQVICPSCGARRAVEKPFYYTDLPRKAVFLVMPRNGRFRFKQDSEALQRAARSFAAQQDGAEQQRRVIYGLDELREKLVAQDAGLDDRHVELLKVAVLAEHPFLLKKPRLLLHLAAASATQLTFAAYYHNEQKSFEIAIARPEANDPLFNDEKLRAWSAKALPGADFFKLPDSWVNFRRLSTRYSALDALRQFAAKVTAGQPINAASAEFAKMLRLLPAPTQLPAWAKTDLRTLFDYAKRVNDQRLEDALFEVRFGFRLEDEWTQNANRDDVDTIWKLLRDLPVSNVEGNANLREINLDTSLGGGGLYGNNVITIDQLRVNQRESFEDVLRHEVGHAVHEQREALVNAWLEQQFGWRRFPRTRDGINQWVQLMGGWGTLTAAQQEEVIRYLQAAIGGGSSWRAGPAPLAPTGSPWWGKNFGPRLAFEKTGDNWFQNFRTWHRANGSAFFLNYWYAEFISVGVNALDLVTNMPSAYASMSHFEFFAEVYSLYYDADDKNRKVIPKDVAKWLDQNIGVPAVGNPSPVVAAQATPDLQERNAAAAKDLVKIVSRAKAGREAKARRPAGGKTK